MTADFTDLLQTYAADLARLRDKMHAQLHSEVALIDDMQAARYFTGGKQLRALLALLAARLHGIGEEVASTTAIGIEFIHTATLLHDDVVDDAARRRHMPTARAAYGNEAAVLAGDFLYSRASQLFAQLGNVRLLQRVSDATNQLAQGELLQLIRRGQSTLSEEDYHNIIRKKTANLFEVAAASAALLSGADDAPLAAFGHELGVAFQLVDDCLDYDGGGDGDGSGKNIGADFKERKMTMPMILLLNRMPAGEQETLIEQWQGAAGDDAGFLQDTIAQMHAAEVFPAVRQMAARHAESAAAALAAYPSSPTREQLTALAAATPHRTH